MLNLASFVHTWMPPEADLLVRENMSKNLIGIWLFTLLFENAELTGRI